LNISVNSSFFIMVFGLALDIILGDPVYYYHPVRIFGRTIEYFVKIFIKKKDSPLINFLKGFLTYILVVAIFVIFYLFVCFFLTNKIIKIIFEIYIFYSLFALKDLVVHINRVLININNNDIKNSRKELSKIVGRKTSVLDKNGILRACLETLSENFTDSIFSPLTYFFLGEFLFGTKKYFFSYGIVFMIIYRITNTFDSMIGYRNEKFEYFGKFSAKLDDVLNFIPARLGILFFVMSTLIMLKSPINGLKCFLQDRKKHNSPNSACSMSYIAGFTNVYLGGDIEYDYGISKKERLNKHGKEIETDDIYISIKLVYISTVLTFIVYGIILCFV